MVSGSDFSMDVWPLLDGKKIKRTVFQWISLCKDPTSSLLSIPGDVCMFV